MGDACLHREERYIYVRDDVDQETYAELVAHELGHWFLDATKPAVTVAHLAELGCVEGSPALAKVEAYGARERQELQANVFARELLLPRDVARQLSAAGRGPMEVAHSLHIPIKIVRQQTLDAVLLPQAPLLIPKPPITPSADQAQAARAEERFVNVVAGPGTGKTSTLIERIKYLVSEKGVNPSHILALTFTNKAAFELVERLRVAGIPDASNVWSGTFHAFGLEFLRKYHDRFGLDSNVQVGDLLNSVMLLNRALPQLTLKHYKRVEDPYHWLGDVVSSIKRLKEELVTPQEYRARLAMLTSVEPNLIRQREDVATLYEAHEAAMQQVKLVDFVDLIAKPAIAMTHDRAKFSELADKFQHILVDEYQDVTKAMVQMVRVLAGKHNAVWVVGDVRQAVHHWRGASVESLTRFEDTFKTQAEHKSIRKYPLAINRRSSQEILEVVIRCGETHMLQPTIRLDRTTSAMGKTGQKPQMVLTPKESVPEAIAAKVLDLRKAGVRFSDQVVLSRWTSHIDHIADEFAYRKIPTLYIGELTQRSEIKQLLCLMQLLTERGPRAVVGLSAVPTLAFSRSDLEQIAAACAADRSLQRGRWISANLPGLSPQGQAAKGALHSLLGSHSRYSTPWNFVCDLLLERRFCLPSAADQSIPAHAQRIALWQFANSLLSGDGDLKASNLTRYLLRTLVRQRINDTYGDRELPAEAATLDAVRLQTVHGCKGLEFEAVHVANVDDQYGQAKPKWSPPEEVKALVPPEVLQSNNLNYAREQAIERQNLLYVAVSRAKRTLCMYSYSDWLGSLPPQCAIPEAPLQLVEYQPQLRPGTVQPASSNSKTASLSFEEFKTYARCPLQHWYRYVLKLPREEDTEAATRARLAVMESLEDCAQNPGLNPAIRLQQAWASSRLPEPHLDPGLWQDANLAFQRGLKLLAEFGGTFVEATGGIAGVSVALPWMMAKKQGPITSHRWIRFFDGGLDEAQRLLNALSTGSAQVSFVEIVHIMSDSVGTSKPTLPKNLPLTNAAKAIARFMAGHEAPSKGYHCKHCAFLTLCPSRPQP